MAARKPRIQRDAFRGWWKWTPVLAVWFSVLFFDAWLNHARLANDYQYFNLLQEHRKLAAELRAIQVDQASLEALDRLDLQAEALGLGEPRPEQIQTISYTPVAETVSREDPFMLARLVQPMYTAEPEAVAPAMPAPAPIETVNQAVTAPLPMTEQETLAAEAIAVAAEPAPAAPKEEASSSDPARQAVALQLQGATPESSFTASSAPEPDESLELLLGNL